MSPAEETGAGDCVGVSTVTWLNGSDGPTRGKTTRKSRASAARSSTTIPTSFAGHGPGSRRHTHAYIAGALRLVFQGGGQAEHPRQGRHEDAVHDDPLHRRVARVARGQSEHPL